MRRINLALILTIPLVLRGSAHAQTPAAFRIVFGVNDSISKRWDGSLKVVQAGQYTLEPWRFEGVDNIDGNLFHFTTHPDPHFTASGAGLSVANGFILTATAIRDTSEFRFSTAQGEFSFRASEVPFGKGSYKLGGRVYVDHLSTHISQTPPAKRVA